MNNQGAAIAEKVDTSGLNPVQRERFWDLAQRWGIRSAKAYRIVCLTPYSESAAKPTGPHNPEQMGFRDRLRKLLNTRTKDNPLTPKDCQELLGRPSKAIASELGYLYKAKEAERVSLGGERKIRYGYWGLNKKVKSKGVDGRPKSIVTQDILNFLAGGKRKNIAAIAQGLNLSNHYVL
jgi:hypothetical protein